MLMKTMYINALSGVGIEYMRRAGLGNAGILGRKGEGGSTLLLKWMLFDLHNDSAGYTSVLLMFCLFPFSSTSHLHNTMPCWKHTFYGMSIQKDAASN